MIQLPWAPALGNTLMLAALLVELAALYALGAMARVRGKSDAPPEHRERVLTWLAVAGQLAALFLFAMGYVLLRINQYILGG